MGYETVYKIIDQSTGTGIYHYGVYKLYYQLHGTEYNDSNLIGTMFIQNISSPYLTFEKCAKVQEPSEKMLRLKRIAKARNSSNITSLSISTSLSKGRQLVTPVH